MSTKKILLIVGLLWVAFFTSLEPLAQAEDWSLPNGRFYPEVKIIRVEPDAITILYRDGGALIPMAWLTPELQRRFNYDPDQARIAADARARSDAESRAALRVERLLAEKLKAIRDAKEEALDEQIAAERRAEDAQYHNMMPEDPGLFDTAGRIDNDILAPEANDPNHKSIHQAVAPPAPDPNHNSMNDAVNSGE